MSKLFQTILRAKKTTYNVVYQVVRAFGLERLLARIECVSFKSKITLKSIKYVVEGTVPAEMELLCSTSRQGLLYIHGKICYRVLKGKFYGLTSWGSGWIAVKQNRFFCRLIYLEHIKNNHFVTRTLCWGMPLGLHQIDTADEKLYITDTYNNAIATLSARDLESCCHWNSAELSYPCGKLSSGRQSKNYRHFNSVFINQGSIYLVAHNETAKTGNKSEIYILDKDMKITSRHTVDGSNCHNFVLFRDEQIVCCSLEGLVYHGNKTVLDTKLFTRGLSVSVDLIVVGASGIDTNRTTRGGSESSLLLLDTEWNQMGTFRIPNTQVCEVRRMDSADFSMSDS